MNHKQKSITRAALLATLIFLVACTKPVGQTNTSAKVSPSVIVTLSSTYTATPTTSKKDYLPTYQAKMTHLATVGTSTVTVTLTPTITPTPRNSTTPKPTQTSTQTLTPTLAPNFKPLAATFMPPPLAVCPPLDSRVVLDEGIFEHLHEIYPDAGKEIYSIHGIDIPYEELDQGFHQLQTDIATYLSQGGSLVQIQALFDQQEVSSEPHYYGELTRVDVTGDGVPEVFVWLALPLSPEGIDPVETGRYISQLGRTIQQTQVFIFTCRQNRYIPTGDFIETLWPGGIRVKPVVYDLDRDGVNEIIQPSYSFSPIRSSIDISIWKWNGEQISWLFLDKLYGDNLVSPFVEAGSYGRVASLDGGDFELLDVDRNGTTEVLLTGGYGIGGSCELLYRETKLVLMWNGHGFSTYYWHAPPVYRIQAVWDGDHMAIRGLYKEALVFFDRVNNDDSLVAWSPDYKYVDLCSDDASALAEDAVPDEGERDKLTAYALYRMMRIYTAIDDLENAQTAYDRLIANYEASIYAKLGTIFWEAYQSSGELGQAHQATVDFSVYQIPNTCDPITDDYADWITNVYYPIEDVCPYWIYWEKR